MRKLAIYVSALLSLAAGEALRHGASQLHDLLAFPKYNVRFLNELPLSSSDAARCRQSGVLNEEDFWALHPPTATDKLSEAEQAPLELVPINFSPPGSPDPPMQYLCLMPSRNSTAAQTSHLDELEEYGELDPVQGWGALRSFEWEVSVFETGMVHLCVCHVSELANRPRLTRSYCHDSHIRQFREGRHEHPHPPGGYTPTEDANFEAYTLGQARHAPPRKAKSLPAAQHGLSKEARESVERATSVGRKDHSPVSVGQSASSRYLTQRWSDGTRCDKNGRPREIEIQVHCSMTSTDVIYSIKEMAICQYVMIIHSPHLCSLPGFHASRPDVESAAIQCRQVIEDEDWEQWRTDVEEQATERPKTLDPGEQWPLGVERRREELDGVPLQKSLKELLHQAIEAVAAKQQAQGPDDSEGDPEVLFLSFDEDGQGMLLDVDMSEMDQGRLRDGDKEMILQVVREYLQQRGEEESDEEGEPSDPRRVVDEL